jgi:hypothetical protein
VTRRENGSGDGSGPARRKNGRSKGGSGTGAVDESGGSSLMHSLE